MTDGTGDGGGDGRPGRVPRQGRDPDVAFPLAIVATALGVVGLSVTTLAWVALLLGAVAYVLNMPHAPTRTLAIIGSTLGLVGVVSALVG